MSLIELMVCATCIVHINVITALIINTKSRVRLEEKHKNIEDSNPSLSAIKSKSTFLADHTRIEQGQTRNGHEQHQGTGCKLLGGITTIETGCFIGQQQTRQQQ